MGTGLQLTCGGATAGGVRYSLEPREREDTERLAWGGVGGLVVGAGPAEVGGCWWAGGGGTPTLLADRLDRGVEEEEERRPWPMSSRAANNEGRGLGY